MIYGRVLGDVQLIRPLATGLLTMRVLARGAENGLGGVAMGVTDASGFSLGEVSAAAPVGSAALRDGTCEADR